MLKLELKLKIANYCKIIFMDALTFALGVILSQKDELNKKRMIAYASRTLNKYE